MEEQESADAVVKEESVVKVEVESGEENSDEEEEDEEDDDDDEDEEEGEENEQSEGDDQEGEVWESDGEDSETEEEDGVDELLEVSDAEGEAAESCPICLNGLREQDVGTPESCDHVFCLECILEWSKNVNTCPIDRQVFRLILCRHSGQDKIYKKIPVQDRSIKEDEEEEDDPVYCEVCQLSDREDRLLLCDGCDLGYHLECLTPPLTSVPVNEWFCPDCAPREEIKQEEQEARTRSRRFRRIIPRTLVMERVRSAIEENRLELTRRLQALASSSEDEEKPSTSSSQPAPTSTTRKTPTPKKATPAKRKAPRKYKRKYKRKVGTKKTTTGRKTTTKRKTTKRKTTRKGRKRRKKVKGRKKKTLARTAKAQPMLTPKMRIAGALGLKSPPAGRSIPLQVSKQEKTMDMKKADIGASHLSIFGSKDGLIHFDDDYGPPTDMPSTSTKRPTKYSQLSLSSYRPIGRVPKIPAVKEKKKIVIQTVPAMAQSPLDLLGSIMNDQSKLHQDSKKITIARDGSLVAKPADNDKSVLKPADNKNASKPAYNDKRVSKLSDTDKSVSKPADLDTSVSKLADNDKINSSSSSLFKSSFTTVGSATEESASVLSALSSSNSGIKEEIAEEGSKQDEEYDPAHPTDDIDEIEEPELSLPKSEAEEYDPAHPTDDVDEMEEPEENLPKPAGEDNDPAQSTDDVDEMEINFSNLEGEEYNPAHPLDDADEVKKPEGNLPKPEGDENDPAHPTDDKDEMEEPEENIPKPEGEDNDPAHSTDDVDEMELNFSNLEGEEYNPTGDIDNSDNDSDDSFSNYIVEVRPPTPKEVKVEECQSPPKLESSSISTFEIEKESNVIIKEIEPCSNDVEKAQNIVSNELPANIQNANVNLIKKEVEVEKCQLSKQQDKPNVDLFPISKTSLHKTDNQTSVQSLSNVVASSAGKKIPVTPVKSDTVRTPNVKITENVKKISPPVKTLGVPRKVLMDKKKLYGADIDFSADIAFSEAGFPENFETKIQEVFKDTKRKSIEEKPTVEKVDKKDESKNKIVDKQTQNKDVAEKKPENVVENHTASEKEKVKFSGLFKPITKKDESKASSKITVSERFSLINAETKELDLEEEDPIHEMRKLDKELDFELEHSDVGKRKDKEHKKSKRKVSIEGDDIDRGKKSKVKKGDSWEEIEEGEVEDEYKYKDKKKKDKKRKKNDKEKYYDDIDSQNDKNDDIDTRIVIQVSQNTEDRTVWEEDEKIRKKKDREERRKERDRSRDREQRKEKKRRRHRSRSRSYERKRSRSRDKRRSRSRSKDRSRKKHKEKSRSWSRDRSHDKSHDRSRKRKKKDRDRSRERGRSKDRTRSRERDRSWDWDKDKKRSREKSEEVDIFGRSRSPFMRKDFGNDIEIVSPKHTTPEPVVYIIDDDSDDSLSPKRPKLADVKPVRKTKKKGKPVSPKPSLPKHGKIQTVSTSKRVESEDKEEKNEEFDDEPEETEQFQYTDRDEYLGQNKTTQQHQNLIQIGVDSVDYDPANPTESSSPAPPPLPELVAAPTPPLPPVGEFGRFPPPPPGPPPGSLPLGMMIQERPPVHVRPPGPPRQGMLGEGPVMMQGPPPPLEAGPPPGLLPQRPNISMSPGMPQAFHHGLPQTIRPQRHVIMSPFRPGMPRVQRLPSPGVSRFGWPVTSADGMPSQFASPGRLPGPPPMMNGPGPYDGLPPPQTEGPPPNLPPNHHRFPPPLIPLQTDGPPPNLMQIPVSMDEPPPMGIPVSHMSLPVSESHLVHIGPHPQDPPPRLPIPLMPTSTPPPMSVVSMPMSGPGAMSVSQRPLIPISSMHGSFPQGSPLNSVSSLLRLPSAHTPPNSETHIPGLDMVGVSKHNDISISSNQAAEDTEQALSQLEEISKILNNQAKLMGFNKDNQNNNPKLNHNSGTEAKDANVFKVPLPPCAKHGSGKCETQEITEVCDMDMASPILEEGNIELPISPEFDNLIDTDDWLEEAFSKNKQNKQVPKEREEKVETKVEPKVETLAVVNDKEKPLSVSKTKVKDQENKKDSPKKPKEEKVKKSSKENKPVHAHHHHRHHKKHRHKPDPDNDNDFKMKALKDAHLEIDSQDMPSSATEMTNKEKYLQKLHLQERVVEEVKMAIKPHYSAKKINKDQYKEILRKAVPKICHSKSGDINPMKIRALVEAYVDKFNKHGSHHDDDFDDIDISPDANGERSQEAQAAR